MPPTPPADDDNDYYFDLVLDMSYDTHMTISPAILAAIAPFRQVFSQNVSSEPTVYMYHYTVTIASSPVITVDLLSSLFQICLNHTVQQENLTIIGSAFQRLIINYL